MEQLQGEGGKRRIKLLCPSLSKIIQIIAADHQKLDLGSIARAFGLDPVTLKLNGHFISRGADLVASSVTWNSLILFFSARGLSTGASDSDALLVDGKLSKIGSKRSHDQEDAGSGILDMTINACSRYNKKPPHDNSSLLENEKANVSNSVRVDSTNQTMGCNGLGLKRKWCVEDGSHVKRSKNDEDVSGCWDRICDASTRISCSSFISKTIKRGRGECDDMVDAASPMTKKRKIIETP